MFQIFVDPSNPTIKILIQDKETVLQEKDWSDWITVSFPSIPPLVKVSGAKLSSWFLLFVKEDLIILWFMFTLRFIILTNKCKRKKEKSAISVEVFM